MSTHKIEAPFDLAQIIGNEVLRHLERNANPFMEGYAEVTLRFTRVHDEVTIDSPHDA